MSYITPRLYTCCFSVALAGTEFYKTIAAMRISWRLGMGHVESVDDYVGVLVPLEQAHLYGQSAKSGKKARSQTQDDDQLDDEETKDGDYEMQGMLQKNVGGYTIEGLRREMREGRQGRWTTYESELVAIRSDGFN